MRAFSKHHLNGNHKPFGVLIGDLTAKEREYLAKRRKRAAARVAIKRHIITSGAMQAKLAKAKLIITPKGKNGRSMSDALLAQHGISLPAKEGA